MSKLAFLTCHLTGTGHLIRTLALARAALKIGHDVTLITGGRHLGHIDYTGLNVVQLPPVRVLRMEFTILGDTVNTASRLESKTKEVGVPVLISEATAAATSRELEKLQQIDIRGREQKLWVYAL